MTTTSQAQLISASRLQGATYAYPLTLHDSDSALVDANNIASDQHDRIEIWVNEGGAGDDVDP